MDIFETKDISPMLIANQEEPFDDPNYIYELKFDGIRALLYSDISEVDIRNKRNKSLISILPELKQLNKQIKGKAIIDGELIVMRNGKPDFYEMQKRALMTNVSKIQIESTLYPVTFVAYDILYLDGKELFHLELTKRKDILNQVIKENDRINISRVIEEKGIDLFSLTKNVGLEGVVAKRKHSIYYPGKRSTSWIKFKNMTDEDYVVVGYIPKPNSMTSLIIAQYDQNHQLVYKGHVTLGVRYGTLVDKKPTIIDTSPLNNYPDGNESAIWLKPELVVTVEYMYNDVNSLRQPVLKGFRDDKTPTDCLTK